MHDETERFDSETVIEEFRRASVARVLREHRSRCRSEWVNLRVRLLLGDLFDNGHQLGHVAWVEGHSGGGTPKRVRRRLS